MELNSLPNPATIDYTNWRGERALRVIRPLSIYWGSNQWHPEKQWLLDAIVEKDGERDVRAFAMKDIHSWN